LRNWLLQGRFLSISNIKNWRCFLLCRVLRNFVETFIDLRDTFLVTLTSATHHHMILLLLILIMMITIWFGSSTTKTHWVLFSNVKIKRVDLKLDTFKSLNKLTQSLSINFTFEMRLFRNFFKLRKITILSCLLNFDLILSKEVH
jgi:hypothetical protein